MLYQNWLLLLFSLPTTESSARLAVWRQLKRIGAVLLRESVYVLPDQPEHRESFQWLIQRVYDEGGEATLVYATDVKMPMGKSMIDLFQKNRTEDYRKLMISLRRFQQSKRSATMAPGVRKFQKQYDAIQKIDFFPPPLAEEVRAAIESIQPFKKERYTPKVHIKDYQGKKWLTRPRPELDRVASAWLIRRFIDPKATFLFAETKEAFPKAISFDMIHANFAHEGEDCTFETLLRRFGLESQKVLRNLANIVHAADIDDEKFSQTEGIGLLAVLRGWAGMGLSDHEILERGEQMLDSIYAQLTKQPFGEK